MLMLPWGSYLVNQHIINYVIDDDMAIWNQIYNNHSLFINYYLLITIGEIMQIQFNLNYYLTSKISLN